MVVKEPVRGAEDLSPPVSPLRAGACPHTELQAEQVAHRVELWYAPEEVDLRVWPAGSQPAARKEGVLPQGRNCAPRAKRRARLQ